MAKYVRFVWHHIQKQHIQQSSSVTFISLVIFLFLLQFSDCFFAVF